MLVVNSGRPLVLSGLMNIPAVVSAIGTQSGHAIASVLYGDYNSSGKLPCLFQTVGQYIVLQLQTNGKISEAVFWSHYIDEDNTPLYPLAWFKHII